MASSADPPRRRWEGLWLPPYSRRLFLMLMAAVWALVGCFLVFQYNRERVYKAEKMDARLQLVNSALLEMRYHGQELDSLTVEALARDMRHLSVGDVHDLRVTLISTADGRVIYDNAVRPLPAGNHLRRPEVAAALSNGDGYSIERRSQSNGEDYFYSARLSPSGSVIIRTAVPYTLDLQEVLRADSNFLWVVLLLAVMVSLGGYVAVSRIGGTVTRLRRFSEMAERGDRIFDSETFPDDELGTISSNIVSLYARLQKTSADRDKEHRRVLAQQEENARMKRELTNNINHELKTPVAAMSLCLETLVTHPTMPEEKRAEFVERCNKECRRLSDMLTDVSTITRMDDGGMKIEKEPLRLAPLVAEAVDEARATPDGTGFDYSVELPDDLELRGNAPLLLSVFRNLLSNALRYSGGTRISIRVVGRSASHVVVEFADNGTGVPAESLPRLFERFYRVDRGRSRRAGGTGLGLSIVKNAVAVHGGTISASNIPSGGLRFTFSLSLS